MVTHRHRVRGCAWDAMAGWGREGGANRQKRTPERARRSVEERGSKWVFLTVWISDSFQIGWDMGFSQKSGMTLCSLCRPMGWTFEVTLKWTLVATFHAQIQNVLGKMPSYLHVMHYIVLELIQQINVWRGAS
jgi:hypothetical protein